VSDQREVRDPASLRAADADRERVAGELREHMLAGRLSPQEFEERVERAYAATTRGELDALSVDLPLSPVALEAALVERRTRLRRRLLQESGGAVSVSAVCVAIWLASGADGGFWPAWVIIFTMLPLLRSAWRLFGPSPDLEAVEAHLGRRAARHRHRGHHGGGGGPRSLPR
jgi:hypothetical protein